MRHGQRDDRDRAGKQIIDIARQLLEQDIKIDGIVHSPVRRTTFAAQTLHAALSPELAEHFLDKVDPESDTIAPEISEVPWLHVERGGNNVFDRMDDLHALNDDHNTIILVTHEPNATAIHAEFSEGDQDQDDPPIWSRLARTIILDLNVKSWKDIEMYPHEVAQQTILEPNRKHYEDPANEHVFDAIEL